MTPEVLFAAMEATWPAATVTRLGPWTIRDGQGGGKRVSAATADAAWSDTDIPQAESAMAALGQPALFLIRDGDGALDAALDARGYRIVDPVLAYAGPAADLAVADLPRLAGFPHWPPLAVATHLWAESGIGPARLAVMERVQTPKTAILARSNDRPAGVAFVATAGNIAMLHALEVAPALRRQGSAHNILTLAARWALDQGADTLALVVTTANDGARALYASHGMAVVGHYHYRQK
jgi:GNAT superfamily N-acetyltransferase